MAAQKWQTYPRQPQQASTPRRSRPWIISQFLHKTCFAGSISKTRKHALYKMSIVQAIKTHTWDLRPDCQQAHYLQLACRNPTSTRATGHKLAIPLPTNPSSKHECRFTKRRRLTHLRITLFASLAEPPRKRQAREMEPGLSEGWKALDSSCFEGIDSFASAGLQHSACKAPSRYASATFSLIQLWGVIMIRSAGRAGL